MAEAIHDCHQYANLRRDPCDDNRIYAKHSQGLIQICLEERTKAPLWQKNICWFWFQIIHDLCPFCSPNGVDLHFSFKDEISLQKAVRGEDDWEPSLPSLS